MKASWIMHHGSRIDLDGLIGNWTPHSQFAPIWPQRTSMLSQWLLCRNDMIIYSWSSLLRTRRDACVICINCSMPFAFIALCDHLARFSSLCHVDSKVLMLYVRSLIVKMAYVAFVELKLSHNIPLLVNEEPPTSCHFNNKDVASSSETPWWCCQRDREETNATAL